MNPRIAKLREEHEKIKAKISELQARDREILKQLRELENTEIVGMVQDTGLTLDQLAALLPTLKENPISKPEKEETQIEE